MGTITTGVGLISGINTGSLIDALINIDTQPVTLLQNQNQLIQSEQVAYQSVSALLLGLKADTAALTNAQTFNATTGTSSNSNLSVTTTASAKPGTYNFNVARLVSTQQTITRGFADATSTALGAGTLSFDFGASRLDADTNLASLNGGAGVARGKIRITDHSGASAVVDLSAAVTVNDVLDAINTASGINVTASVQGDHLLLSDNTGLGTGSLTVANVGTTGTAASLGLAGTSAAATLAGTDINVVGNATALSSLNDGNGVRTVAGLSDLSILTAGGATIAVNLDGAATLGDVVSKINSAAGNAGAVTASLTKTGLQLVDNTTGGSTFTVSALNGSNSAADLGILGSSGTGTITGTRLIAGLNSKLVKNLGGGNLALTPGTVNINGTAVDLSGVQSVSDIVSAINNSAAGVTASLNAAGDGLKIATNNNSALTISDTTGNLAASLHLAGSNANGTIDSGNLQLKYLSEATPLQSLNGGTGIAAGKFTVTDSSGASAVVDLSQGNETTLADVISEINSRGLAVNARINDNGDGILIQDTGPGVTALSVTESGSTTAHDLGIFGTASAPGQNLNGSFEKTVTVSATDTLSTLADKINAAGIGVSASVINDGSSASPFRLSLQSNSSGLKGAFVLNDGGLGLGASNLVDAQNAVVFYGSADPSKAITLTSSTNSLTTVVPGATINLSSTGAATVSISQDNSAIDTAVQKFVTDFNSVITTLNKYDSYDTTTQTAGLLLGDSTVQNVRSSLYRYINTFNTDLTGSVRSLGQLGIAIGDGGQLTFDQSKLDAALQTNRGDVVQLFTYKETSTDPLTNVTTTTKAGIGVNIDNLLASLTDSNNGMLQSRIDTLTSQTKLNTDRITQLNTMLTAERARLQAQFTNMESVLAQLQSQGSALTSLSSLLASSTNSNSSSSTSSSSTKTG